MTSGREPRRAESATGRVVLGLILFPAWFPVILLNVLAHATARMTDRLIEGLRRTKARWMLAFAERDPVVPPQPATEFREFVRQRSGF